MQVAQKPPQKSHLQGYSLTPIPTGKDFTVKRGDNGQQKEENRQSKLPLTPSDLGSLERKIEGLTEHAQCCHPMLRGSHTMAHADEQQPWRAPLLTEGVGDDTQQHRGTPEVVLNELTRSSDPMDPVHPVMESEEENADESEEPTTKELMLLMTKMLQESKEERKQIRKEQERQKRDIEDQRACEARSRPGRRRSAWQEKPIETASEAYQL